MTIPTQTRKLYVYTHYLKAWHTSTYINECCAVHFVIHSNKLIGCFSVHVHNILSCLLLFLKSTTSECVKLNNIIYFDCIHSLFEFACRGLMISQQHTTLKTNLFKCRSTLLMQMTLISKFQTIDDVVVQKSINTLVFPFIIFLKTEFGILLISEPHLLTNRL